MPTVNAASLREGRTDTVRPAPKRITFGPAGASQAGVSGVP